MQRCTATISFRIAIGEPIGSSRLAVRSAPGRSTSAELAPIWAAIHAGPSAVVASAPANAASIACSRSRDADVEVCDQGTAARMVAGSNQSARSMPKPAPVAQSDLSIASRIFPHLILVGQELPCSPSRPGYSFAQKQVGKMTDLARLIEAMLASSMPEVRSGWPAEPL